MDNRKQVELRRNKYNNKVTGKKEEEKSVFRKILEVLSSVFAVIVIIASLFTLVFRVIFKVEVVKVFGYSGLIVLTGSMEKTYFPGDLIFIKEQKAYNVQDVITFHQRGMIVTHRIVEKKDESTFVTKGDNNNTEDPEIKITDIEGKVIGSIPKVGKAILFLQTPAGIVSILVVLISLEAFFAAKRKMVKG